MEGVPDVRGDLEAQTPHVMEEQQLSSGTDDDRIGSTRRVAVDTVATVVSTGAGTVLGGPVGAVVGAAASPALGAALDKLIESVGAWRARRAGDAFREAAAMSELGEDELAKRLATDERLVELAGRVFQVAQDVALPEKRRALAAVLGESAKAQDPSTIDRALLLASALAALDGPHIRLMAVLEQARRLPEEDGDLGSDKSFGMSVSEVERADAGLDGTAAALLRTLLAYGLAEDATNGMTFLDRVRTFALSSLGEDVLGLLRLPPSFDGM